MRSTVAVVESLPVPLAGPLGPEVDGVCAGLHADHGVRLLPGAVVADLTGTTRVAAVERADGRRLPHVVDGIGALPDVAWPAGSGLVLGVDQPRPSTRWRRQQRTAVAAGA